MPTFSTQTIEAALLAWNLLNQIGCISPSLPLAAIAYLQSERERSISGRSDWIEMFDRQSAVASLDDWMKMFDAQDKNVEIYENILTELKISDDIAANIYINRITWLIRDWIVRHELMLTNQAIDRESLLMSFDREYQLLLKLREVEQNSK